MSIAEGTDLLAEGAQETDVLALIVRIQARDMQALEQLYGALASRLKIYIKRFVRSDQYAEDVVHDVFLRIWRYAASFDALKVGRPESWIFQIARNHAISQAALISRSVSVDSFDAEDGHLGIEFLAEALDNVNLIDKVSARSLAFQRAVASLPPNYRQTIYLRYHRDLTHQQIADVLRIPVGTVKTWLRRALLQLRKRLHVRIESEGVEEVRA